MRARLLAIVFAVVLLYPAQGTTEMLFPRLLLQTPYDVEAAFGKPDDVEGSKAGNGTDLVEWTYLTNKKFYESLNDTVGSTALRVRYTDGRVSSIYVTPGESYPTSPKVYIPSNVVFKVRDYDDIGKVIGTPERPYVVLGFSNRYVRGTCRALVPPMKKETLQASGHYKVSYDFVHVWDGEALSVELELQPKYRDILIHQGDLPKQSVEEIKQMPTKK